MQAGTDPKLPGRKPGLLPHKCLLRTGLQPPTQCAHTHTHTHMQRHTGWVGLSDATNVSQNTRADVHTQHTIGVPFVTLVPRAPWQLWGGGSIRFD